MGSTNVLENLSEDDINLLMQLGIIPEQQAGISKQQDYADALRGTKQPRGMEVGPGGIYVGASPLEHIASAMQRAEGMSQTADLQGRSNELLDKETKGRKRFLEILLRQRQAQDPGAEDTLGY